MFRTGHAHAWHRPDEPPSEGEGHLKRDRYASGQAQPFTCRDLRAGIDLRPKDTLKLQDPPVNLTNMKGQKILSCGPDTLHLTFREAPDRTPEELSELLAEFNKIYDIPTNTIKRDKGLSGFASSAIDKAAGLRLDWTRPGEEGSNQGYFCLQVGGRWFGAARSETQVDFLQLLEAYGPLRATRLDFQQTVRTDDHLTPWWIKKFERGDYRVLRCKHYEPRGKKDHSGDFPEGSTLYHGSRTSNRFARQYDKHLESQTGLPRRRDEIEIKGEDCRNLYTKLHQDLLDCEQTGQDRGETLFSFAKRSIRAFLPIRDTSRWKGKQLPQNWAQMAEEPTTWATLFDEDALTIKPREARVTGLIKSYRYATANFGAAVAVRHAYRARDLELDGMTEDAAYSVAAGEIVQDFYRDSNAERAKEFCCEFPTSDAMQLLGRYVLAKEAAEAMDGSPEGPIT